MISPSGSIFYADDYGIIYKVEWEEFIIDGVTYYDFTTITSSPHVWGVPDAGYIEHRQVYRNGIVTTFRQVIMVTEDGYLVMAEGSSQVVSAFQTTFLCAGGPSDTFKHHLNNEVQDEFSIAVQSGPRFTDPEPSGRSLYNLTEHGDDLIGDYLGDANPTHSDNMAFSDLNSDGTFVSLQIFRTIDVWPGAY